MLQAFPLLLVMLNGDTRRVNAYFPVPEPVVECIGYIRKDNPAAWPEVRFVCTTPDGRVIKWRSSGTMDV